jgi:hypothetical protein
MRRLGRRTVATGTEPVSPGSWDPTVGGAVAERRYEFHVAGRLSATARSAFSGMDVREVPTETVISTVVDDDGEMHRVLDLIQSLGLHVVSFERLPAGRTPPREPR